MLISALSDSDGSRCTLSYDQANGWLVGTWKGFVDPHEAQRGSQNYLRQLRHVRCAYLLNDNSRLRGPWFDSIQWLAEVWVPEAAEMGVRYVAHVVQADTLHDVLTDSLRTPLRWKLELQIFQTVAEAEDWLRRCQQADQGAAPQQAA